MFNNQCAPPPLTNKISVHNIHTLWTLFLSSVLGTGILHIITMFPISGYICYMQCCCHQKGCGLDRFTGKKTTTISHVKVITYHLAIQQYNFSYVYKRFLSLWSSPLSKQYNLHFINDTCDVTFHQSVLWPHLSKAISDWYFTYLTSNSQ